MGFTMIRQVLSSPHSSVAVPIGLRKTQGETSGSPSRPPETRTRAARETASSLSFEHLWVRASA
jgi:hypothetical protein